MPLPPEQKISALPGVQRDAPDSRVPRIGRHAGHPGSAGQDMEDLPALFPGSAQQPVG